MNKKFIVLSFIFLFLLGKVAYAQQLDLSECQQLARDNYPEIKRYSLLLQSENYTISNIRKAWLPQLNIQAKATIQSDVTHLPFDAEKLSAIMPGIDLSPVSKDQYQVMAEVHQVLWDGGRIKAKSQLEQKNSWVSRKAVEKDLYAIRERVNQLYFGCLLQAELIKQNQLCQDLLQTNLKAVRDKYNNGIVSLADCQYLEVEILKVQQQAIEMKSSIRAYYKMLGLLIGKELDESSSELKEPIDLDILNSTIILRPELELLDAQMDALNQQNKVLSASVLPQIGLFVQGGYGKPSLNMLQNSFNTFYVAGIRLSWNIGNFYTLKNAHRNLKVQSKLIENQKETFLFNTHLQEERELQEIQKIRTLIKNNEQIIVLRTEIRKAAEARLKNGVFTVVDLVREINAEDQAKRTAVTERLNYLMALYQHKHTIGL